ncbi:MAG: hypothetical protein WCK89_16260 [bacterium]
MRLTDISSTQRHALQLTFVESFVTILIERGVYFYTCHTLGFSDRDNLLLALAFGLVYAATAVVSHWCTKWWGERNLLWLTLFSQLVVTLAMAALPSAGVVVAGTILLGGLYGLKWPVLESYMLAGDTPSRAVSTVGRFSMSWSIAIPLALAAAGPLIGAGRIWLFLAAVAAGLPSFFVVWHLPPRPLHLPHDHPEHLPPPTAARWRRLLVASRVLMFTGYAQLWVLAALLPGIYVHLSLPVSFAAGLSGMVDLMRFAAFTLFGIWIGWHDRRWPVAAVLIGQPLGFALVCLGGSLAWVLLGELIFGLSLGLTYYAALYYAMTLKRGAVEAGGGHEGLVGLGFAVGPGLVLLGKTLGFAGNLPGMAVLVTVCSAWAWGAVRTLNNKVCVQSP